MPRTHPDSALEHPRPAHKLPARRICHLIGLACWLAAAAAASDASITAQLDPEEIFRGESATLQVQVKDADNDVKLDTSALEADFDVSLSGGPSRQQSVQIFNGQMYRESTVTWEYRLVPKKSGTLTVKGPVAVTGGRRIAAKDMALRVTDVPPQDLVQMEIVAPAHVYRTPFDVMLRILVRPLPDGSTRDPLSVLPENPALQIAWVETPEGLQAGDFREWLQKYLTSTGRGFSINDFSTRGDDDPFSMFASPKRAAFSLYTGRETRKSLDGSEINYYVYELKRTFTPQRTGMFKFGPVTLKGTFADQRQGRQFTGKRLVLAASPRTVEVREVPSPRPANFIGGVGDFTVSATATPSNLRVGDPLTLRLNIERHPGSSLLDTIAAPDLAKVPGLAENFDVIDKAPVGEVRGESKIFNYGLRPKKAGVTIPALPLAVFDPVAETFKELKTEPVALTVEAGTRLKNEDIVSAAPVVNAGHGLKNLEGDIFQNVTDLAAIGNQRVEPFWYLGAAGMLLALYCGSAAAIAHRRKRAGDERWQRRQRAWPEASEALKQAHAARNSGDAPAAAQRLRGAVSGLIGNMLNLPAAGMTPSEAGQALSAAGVDEALCVRTTGLLEQVDALQYASSSSAEMNSLLAAADEVLPALRRVLEARR